MLWHILTLDTFVSFVRDLVLLKEHLHQGSELKCHINSQGTYTLLFIAVLVVIKFLTFFAFIFSVIFVCFVYSVFSQLALKVSFL